jgi:hypothetical protein
MDPQDKKEIQKPLSIDERIKALDERIKKMEQETEKLFQDLGISPHFFHEVLHNKDLISDAERAEFQKKAREFEMMLERKLDAIKSSIPTKQTPFQAKPGSHWIFMK